METFLKVSALFVWVPDLCSSQWADTVHCWAGLYMCPMNGSTVFTLSLAVCFCLTDCFWKEQTCEESKLILSEVWVWSAARRVFVVRLFALLRFCQKKNEPAASSEALICSVVTVLVRLPLTTAPRGRGMLCCYWLTMKRCSFAQILISPWTTWTQKP